MEPTEPGHAAGVEQGPEAIPWRSPWLRFGPGGTGRRSGSSLASTPEWGGDPESRGYSQVPVALRTGGRGPRIVVHRAGPLNGAPHCGEREWFPLVAVVFRQEASDVPTSNTEALMYRPCRPAGCHNRSRSGNDFYIGRLEKPPIGRRRRPRALLMRLFTLKVGLEWHSPPIITLEAAATEK